MSRPTHLRLAQSGEAPQPPLATEGVIASAGAMIASLGPADARRVAAAILGIATPSAPYALLSQALEAIEQVELHPDTRVDVSINCRALADDVRNLRQRQRVSPA